MVKLPQDTIFAKGVRHVHVDDGGNLGFFITRSTEGAGDGSRTR